MNKVSFVVKSNTNEQAPLKRYHVVLIALIAGAMLGAALPAKAVGMESTVSAEAANTDYLKGMDAQNKASAYVACAFFGDMSTLAKKPDSYSVSTVDVDKFRTAALKQYRIMNKYFQVDESGDKEVIYYAEFVASQEALLWDKEGMNSKNQEAFNSSALKHYSDSNCPVLLGAIK